MEALGLPIDALLVDVILPVGISFYTFQTLGYTIDVYRKRQDPVRNFVDFALYVSFFPQLVAGPIERAERLLPQFQKDRRVDYTMFRRGVSLILVGAIVLAVAGCGGWPAL